MTNAVVELQNLATSPFGSVRTTPWAMILLGPLHVGLHRVSCPNCDSDSLIRSYHSATVALLHEDSPDLAEQRRELGRDDEIALSQKVMNAPCWVTAGPVQIKALMTPPAPFVREFSKRASLSFFLPLAQNKLIAGLLGSTCPNCQTELKSKPRPAEFIVAVTDAHGDFDMRPMPAVGNL